MTKDLFLPLNAEHFFAIKNGAKRLEYRLKTPYWTKRLEGKVFRKVVLTLGYPKQNDQTRRIERPWKGMQEATITHPHFGPHPVEVYAIDVS